MRHVDPDRLENWLRDLNTPTTRVGRDPDLVPETVAKDEMAAFFAASAQTQ